MTGDPPPPVDDGETEGLGTGSFRRKRGVIGHKEQRREGLNT